MWQVWKWEIISLSRKKRKKATYMTTVIMKINKENVWSVSSFRLFILHVEVSYWRLFSCILVITCTSKLLPHYNCQEWSKKRRNIRNFQLPNAQLCKHSRHMCFCWATNISVRRRAVPSYQRVIRSKTYRGYVKPRIIPNSEIFV
jgi:hypothetical protein